MKKENNKIKIAAVASSAAIIGAFGTTANAAGLLNFEDLGTGSELRSSLISVDALNTFTSNTDVEFECGEGKCGEDKSSEHKCGEGKCGEKSDTKAESDGNTEMKAADESSSEGSTEMKVDSKSEKSSTTESTKDDPEN